MLSCAVLLVKAKYNGKWPYAIKYLIEDVEVGDHVWIHQKGEYYLCKAEEKILFGKSIDDEFLSLDLGHARKAKWLNIPERYVSGSIQRGTIARRSIQKINILKKEEDYHDFIFNKLSDDQNWQPDIKIDELSRLVSKIKIDNLFSLMSSDDFEDVISAYLQSKEWVLIKSTCFRSKPKYEFSMLNKESKVCHVQVKAGTPSCRLRPSDYSTNERDEIVFLFSTHKNPYPGKSINGVNTLAHEDVFEWVKENVWSLTTPLKLRLWIFLKLKQA